MVGGCNIVCVVVFLVKIFFFFRLTAPPSHFVAEILLAHAARFSGIDLVTSS